MKRRQFLKSTFPLLVGSCLTPGTIWGNKELFKDLIIGHNGFTYKVDVNWGSLNSSYFPVNDCHEMVMDKRGRILLLTNHVQNNVIVYDQNGTLQEVWGTEFPGAHGLTYSLEGDDEYLYICDNNRHEVIKTTIDGKIVQIISCPLDSGKYKSKDQFIPTESAIAPNGDIYVADGYGSQYISHFNSKGELLNIFGGNGSKPEQFNNAHGICLDTRSADNPTLLITARMQNKLKRFSLDGKLINIIDLPGAYICRPVIHGDEVYMATLVSKMPMDSGTGFVTILDKNDNVVSVPGGSKPEYTKGELLPLHQTTNLFTHPHDVCIDQDKNLYVAQWNSGKTYPIKLIRQ